MPAVLSTKLLSPAQKNLLLNANLSLTEYNAIKTEALEIPDSVSEKEYPNAIITSQTTVDFIQSYKLGRCFCVGQKTAKKLQSLGFDVEQVADNAKALASSILENYSELTFTYFGSLKRRPELSKTLKQSNIRLDEVFMYDTHKVPKSFHRSFDAVLLFSPSGVESYFEANPSSKSKLICIGPTTLASAKDYSKNAFMSNTTSVESVIVKAVNLLKPKNPAV
ncbi:uroporphyrinogen-III synthase [Psychroflexus tropicus]|uniref:uroporphyrinogen-III synthase n=1 Tax=Psychroflexus tropicus TaxID=197345 RepID=UPI00036F800B|nr:uroporphyrinogen-III synthase [Psychroflexus tropicus]